MRDLLQAKIDEFVALLAQAQCDRQHILLEDTENEASLEFAGQIKTLRDMVDYYVD